MKILISAALIAFASMGQAQTYDFAACEMVLEDISVHRNPADPTATRLDADLTERQIEIRSRRTETAIRQLGGWDLLDDYAGASYDYLTWMTNEGPRLKALPDKAAREEAKSYITALCA